MNALRTYSVPEAIQAIVVEEANKEQTARDMNRAIYKRCREAYIDKRVSHEDFYVWLAGFIGVTAKDLPVSRKTILGSKAAYMNDIPLEWWDKSYPLTKMYAFSMGLGWSYSDNVCVMKTLAKQIVEEEKAKKSESGSGEIAGI